MENQEQRDLDQQAAEELALDMGFIQAAKFLRGESGMGLRDCGYWAASLARKHPGSPLAASLAKSGFGAATPNPHPHLG